jgi:hypothetical protein
MGIHDGNSGWFRALTAVNADVDTGSIAATASVEFTVTVAGAKVGDVVIATPSIRHSTGATANTVSYYAYVSSANTVTVHIANNSAAAIDPPDNVSWRVVVFQMVN